MEKMNDVNTLSNINNPDGQVEPTAQALAEAEYHRAKDLDCTATAERAARLLRSGDDPDGVCPI